MQSEQIALANGLAGGLRKTLNLWDLVFFGLICITPIAPLPPFGIAEHLSNGHATLAILIAMVAMLMTAVSYGRMAARYPVAGSAYSYVSQGLNPTLGFLAGWATFLDYLIIPTANVIYCAAAIVRVVPRVPYFLWAALFACLSTILNLRGVRTSARVNRVMLVFMLTVVAGFAIAAIHYLITKNGIEGLFSLTPIYNPATFDFAKVRTATSFAALTYIGFDAVTTLSEEAKDARRTVPLATVLVCLLTGIIGSALVYLAHSVWPDYHSFRNLDTAFMDVTRRAGGAILFMAMAVVLILAQFGSAMTGHAGAARLLFGMGRSNVLPARFFAHIDARWGEPAYNVLLIGALSFAGALMFNFEEAAEVLNFGAFLAFMGVNLAVIRSSFRKAHARQRQLMLDLIVPVSGFLFCLTIWISLPRPAIRIGSIWLIAGLIYYAVLTRGFRRPPPAIEFSGC